VARLIPSRRDLWDLVPEGLNDRSDSTELAEVQAIYCLEQVQSRNPSRRARSDPYPRLISRPDRSTPTGPNHTVPYGTVPFLHGYQAINCLATIIQSLRDEKPP